MQTHANIQLGILCKILELKNVGSLNDSHYIALQFYLHPAIDIQNLL
jgi:hypothetical protein